MKARVKVIFPALKQGEPGWPHVDYDYNRRLETTRSELPTAFPMTTMSPMLQAYRAETICGVAFKITQTAI